MSDRIEAKVTHRFRASPERVFDAFVDPVLARRWQAAWLKRSGQNGRLTQSQIDPRVGGSFLLADERESGEARHWGTFLALDRPTKISFSWIVDESAEDDPSIVSLIIEPEPNGPGSVVTLYNEMDAQWEDWLAQTEKGWIAMLTGIEDVIERRDIPPTLNA
ncbi:SRPBCC domain-containing protein [Devosia sp.]|uniref:SRPBCC family protein n=1 Tax=Devosia sp. TaxID=1871048 RepID=UPI001B005801|nr:SRPBCC domain-containing protein [Devosia sp.]MBO9588725.1 SRPBCC domain-containing protein [Devosia sp.]